MNTELPVSRETVLIKTENEGISNVFAGYYDGERWFALFPDDDGNELTELVLTVVYWEYLSKTFF